MSHFLTESARKSKGALVAGLLSLLLALSLLPMAGCSQGQQVSSQASSSSAAASSSAASAQNAQSADELAITVEIDPTAAAGAYDEAAFASVGAPESVSLDQGATAYDALVATGAEIDGTPSYVTSINGLGEGAAGQSSGWMYEVNGEMPTVAANEMVLNDGDVVRWYYSSWE